MQNMLFLQRLILRLLVFYTVFPSAHGMKRKAEAPLETGSTSTQSIDPQGLKKQHLVIDARSYPYIAANFEAYGNRPQEFVLIGTIREQYPLKRTDLKLVRIFANMIDEDFDVTAFEDTVTKYLDPYSQEAIKNIVELLSIYGSLNTEAQTTTNYNPVDIHSTTPENAISSLIQGFNDNVSETQWETVRLASYLEATEIYYILCKSLASQYHNVFQNLTGKGAIHLRGLPLLSNNAVEQLDMDRFYTAPETASFSPTILLTFAQLLEHSRSWAKKMAAETDEAFAKRLDDTKLLAGKNLEWNMSDPEFFSVLHLAFLYGANDFFDELVQQRLVKRAYDSFTGSPSFDDALKLSLEYTQFSTAAGWPEQSQATQPQFSIQTIYTNNEALLKERTFLEFQVSLVDKGDLSKFQKNLSLSELLATAQYQSHKYVALGIAYFKNLRRSVSYYITNTPDTHPYEQLFRKLAISEDRSSMSINLTAMPTGFVEMFPTILSMLIGASKRTPKDIGLDLSDNKDLTWDHLAELNKFKDLTHISVQNCELEGSIPESLIASHPQLRTINFCDNQITGVLPEALKNCSALFGLYLSNNKLEGSIPAWLFDCKNLTKIDLSNNNLTGIIPDLWNKCDELLNLNLSSNQFEGNIPDSLRLCQNLNTLNLSHNKLNLTELPNWLKIWEHASPGLCKLRPQSAQTGD